MCYNHNKERRNTVATKIKRPADPGISEDFLQRNEHYMEIIRGLRLIDDDFMSKVFEDLECTQLVLNIILDRDDLIVREVHPQYDIRNLQGRSVRLDILAEDKDGRTYNVEIQRSDKGAGFKRARYNSSLIDANLSNPGDAYDKLGETYVIFITENDVIKAGLPIYHVDRIIRETGEVFNDGAHIIYVNASHRSNTPLGKLMHDFNCLNAGDMYYGKLATRVQYFKETEKGVTNMCREIEKLANERFDEGRAEGKAEGKAEGEANGKAKVIFNLMNNANMDFKEATKMAGCSEEEASALKPLVDAMITAEK